MQRLEEYYNSIDIGEMRSRGRSDGREAVEMQFHGLGGSDGDSMVVHM
jgi:hypothetical protein